MNQSANENSDDVTFRLLRHYQLREDSMWDIENLTFTELQQKYAYEYQLWNSLKGKWTRPSLRKHWVPTHNASFKSFLLRFGFRPGENFRFGLIDRDKGYKETNLGWIR